MKLYYEDLDLAALILVCKVRASIDSQDFAFRLPVSVDDIESMVVKVDKGLPIVSQIVEPYSKMGSIKQLVHLVEIKENYRDRIEIKGDCKVGVGSCGVYLGFLDFRKMPEIEKAEYQTISNWPTVPKIIGSDHLTREKKLLMLRVFQVLQGFLDEDVEALELTDKELAKIKDEKK